MKRLLIICCLLFLIGCKEKNPFKEAIRRHTQTEERVTIVRVDTVTYSELWDYQIEVLSQIDPNDSFINELRLWKERDTAHYISVFRIVAKIGKDTSVYLSNANIDGLILE